MFTPWREAVISALERYSLRHKTVQVERSNFIDEELARIVADTKSLGKTPEQTASRVLQELRDEGFLFFTSAGRYVLNRTNIEVTAEDLPDDALANAVKAGNLSFNDIETNCEIGKARLRKGMNALRNATLSNYNNHCALCDISDKQMLVTSHIARWADNPEARGKLTNTICFCCFHDRLFEYGYFSLTDKLQLIIKKEIESRSIQNWINYCSSDFRVPTCRPDSLFLGEHRRRVGLQG